MQLESPQLPHFPEFVNAVAGSIQQSQRLERLVLVTAKQNGGVATGVGLSTLARIVGVDSPLAKQMNHPRNPGLQVGAIVGL